MSAQTDVQDGLLHHRHAWSQHELLASILSRYVHVQGEQGGRWPSWQVSPHEGENIHTVLGHLNQHLHRLGWMVRLSTNEGYWMMTVFPIPERQFPRIKTVGIFWVLSTLTLTLAGDQWIESSRTPSGWFVNSTLLDAFFCYTLPILFAFFLASNVQKWLASRYGVRCGQLLPVPDFTIALYAIGLFPSSWLFWPFGVLLIPTLPRMDARPWPDRSSLGFTALSVPLTLGVFGVVFFFAGIYLTPEYIESHLMPLITDPPVFIGLLANQLIHDDAWVRLAWAHPLVHAGGMLMFFAWVSLLPVPTFPGGRILIARMGMKEARSSSVQSLIFISILFCAYVFGVFNSFSLWFLVFALILPLLFSFGSDTRIPFILNETTGLTEQHHQKMGLRLLVLFLLLLPAAQPIVHDSHWADELTYEVPSPQVAVLQEDGTWKSRTQIQVSNPSSLQKPYAIDAIFQFSDHSWEIEWDCDGEIEYDINGEGCGSTLLPKRTATFWMNLSWDAQYSPTLANGSFLLNINDAYSVIPFQVKPAMEVVPGERWYDMSSGSSVLRCLDLFGELLTSTWVDIEVFDAPLEGVQTSLVHLDGQSGMKANYTEIPERVCLSGLDPLVFQPSMGALRMNNETFQPALPQRRELQAFIPESGWNVHADEWQYWGSMLEEGNILTLNADHCPINAALSTPLRPAQGDWVWDMAVFSTGQIPSLEGNQSLNIKADSGSKLMICNNMFSPYPALEFPIKEGPELIVSWMGSTSRFWSTPWAIAMNGTLLNEGMSNLTFFNPSDESIPFRLARAGSPGEDWQYEWSGNTLEPGVSNISLIPPQSPLSTMWITLESGTVVLHLASYQ